MYEELVRKIRTLTAQKTRIGLETQAEVSDVIEKLDNYVSTCKKAQANGLLIVLPCKLGTTVYRVEQGHCSLHEQYNCDVPCDGRDNTCSKYSPLFEVHQGQFTLWDLENLDMTSFLTLDEAKHRAKQLNESINDY